MKKSFTLIELLVVIAVVGMLASIVLVSLKGTSDKARIARAENFSSQIAHTLGSEARGIWDFNGNANDSSGYGNNGAITGAVLVADRNGEANKAYSFNGFASINAGAGTSLDVPNDFTLEAWVKVNGLPANWAGIVNKPAVGTPVNYRIFISNGGNVFGEVYGGVSATLDSNTNINDGKWHHVAFVRDTGKDTLFIYVDGALRGQQNDNTTSSIVSSGSSLMIGYGGNNFNGVIDAVRMYGQAMSVTQIQQLYAKITSRYSLTENVIQLKK